MGCNCKKISKFEKEHGVLEEESILQKITRLGMRYTLFVIAILLAIIVTPFMMGYVIFKLFSKSEKTITIPTNIIKSIYKKNG